jgi:Zn-dependent protease
MNVECFIIVTVLWVFSVCLHEFGHAWVAYQGGDDTVREKGYLTMNPLHYTDPIFSIILPVVFLLMGGIGLPGGAVYINHHLLRSRAWSTAVSLAGPAMNVILILLIALLFKLGVLPSDPSTLATISMAFLLQLQVSALLLNLLPVPPLDGFQALAAWMQADHRERMLRASNVTFFALFLALAYVPPVNDAFWSIVHGVCDFLGVPREWGWEGYRVYKFWRE